jgi:hypothetical protein
LRLMQKAKVTFWSQYYVKTRKPGSFSIIRTSRRERGGSAGKSFLRRCCRHKKNHLPAVILRMHGKSDFPENREEIYDFHRF